MDKSKNIEKLIDKIMTDDDLSSTSMHFTDAVMAQVEQLDKKKKFEYTPLISKKIGLLICIIIVGILTYTMLYGNLTKSKWMNYFDFNLNLNLLPEMNFSNTTIYATTIVSVFFLVQLIMLKNYFNKRLSL